MDNYSALLCEAIAEARAAGLDEAVEALDRAASMVYTTSSEYLGETGLAIAGFLRAAGKTAPPSVVDKLRHCLREVRRVWPGIRG